MLVYEDALKFCDDLLVSKIGKHWNELDSEGWYDTKIFNGFMTNYAKASPSGEKAIVTLSNKFFNSLNNKMLIHK